MSDRKQYWFEMLCWNENKETEWRPVCEHFIKHGETRHFTKAEADAFERDMKNRSYQVRRKELSNGAT